MMEILEFIFQDFWHFIGSCIILYMILVSAFEMPLKYLNNKLKVKYELNKKDNNEI